jgi:hypothetical protein
MNKFQSDLLFGQRYERILMNHIPYRSFVIENGYFPDYDVKVYKKNGSKSTYEVKADRQINIYSNICIEYMCNNKPSGISTSKAKYWAIFEPKGENYILYKIPSKIIRKYIEEQKYFKNVIGGDNKASKLYLFKKDLFKDYIIYNDINE